MKFTLIIFTLCFFLSNSAKNQNTSGKIYLLDSLEEKYLHIIHVIVETSSDSNFYYFSIGKVERGFIVLGGNHKINKLRNDTTRRIYLRSILENSQLDSLKKFEQKLMLVNKVICNKPRQRFNLYYGNTSTTYLIEGDMGWDPVGELILILFRQKDKNSN